MELNVHLFEIYPTFLFLLLRPVVKSVPVLALQPFDHLQPMNLDEEESEEEEGKEGATPPVAAEVRVEIPDEHSPRML